MIKKILAIILMCLLVVVPIAGNVGTQEARAEDSIDVPVTVIWKDTYEGQHSYENQNWKWARPDSINVSLMNGDSKIDEISINGTSGSFSSVPSDNSYSVISSYIPKDQETLLEYKRVNKAYTYSYETEVTGSAEEGFTITNTLVSDIKGNVIWKGDKTRPDSVTVNLLKNGEVIDSQEVTKDNDYAFDFGRYTVYSDDGMILYTTSVDRVTDYFSEPNGYDIVLTPETKVTLTKELKGTSKEEEFGVYIVPIHYQYDLYIQKLWRRYPYLEVHILPLAQKIINNAKMYDETSGKEPIYPLLSKLFDEEWVNEQVRKLNEGEKLNWSENERNRCMLITYMIYGENHLNDNFVTVRERSYDEFSDNLKWLHKYLFVNYQLFSGLDDSDSLSEVIGSDGDTWASFDEYVDDVIIDNMFFYTTIKAGETKTINIPAEELISLIIVETDYNDIEEFETIYWNEPGFNNGYIMYGGISMRDYYQNGNDQAKNEFEYTLTNRGQVVPTKLNITGKKQLTGKDLSDNQFSFVLKEDDAVIDEATCDAQGNISFKEIEYTEEGEHTYTIEEKNDNQAGYEYDTHIETAKVNVTKDDDYNLVATPEYDSDGVIFTNEYNATGSVVLEAAKSLTGKEITNDQFTFELKDGDNVISTAKNKDGKIIFDAIDYTEADAGKEFTYTIAEVNDAEPGYIYDTHTATVKVSVNDNGDGTLTATPTYTDAEFNNEYTATGAATIEATKSLTGKDLTDGQFRFELRDSNDEVIETVSNIGSKITFSPISYSLTDVGKEFTYTIVEKNDNQPGYEYDTHTATIKVSVTDNGDGTLTTTPVYTDSEFVNVYSASGSVNIEATKNLTGRSLEDNQFNFELKNGDEVISTASNKGNLVKFSPINYTIADAGKEFTYTIVEVNNNAPGYTYDTHEATVKVSVIDNGDGTLTATPVYDTDGVVFNNTYSATGKTAISGKKVFNNKAMEYFTFVLKEGDTEIATVKNSDTGEFVFPEIEYDLKDVGKHTYTITETNDSKPGVTYDEHVETVTVDVTDNGDGTLKVETIFDEDGVVFTNTYNADGTFIISGIKKFEGKDLADGDFTFILTDKDGNTKETTVKADGTFEFEPFSFTVDDIGKTFTYKVTEKNTGTENVTYDEHTEEITITVEDNGDGTLKITPVYDEDGVVFVNKYTEPVIETPVETPTEEPTETSVDTPTFTPDGGSQEATPQTPETTTVADTGDASVMPLIIAGILSAVGIIATGAILKKRKHD